MGFEAKVIADSIASDVRLTTLQVTGPRIVLAEFNTHRVFSRNSASSRAIPVEKRIQQILDDPFVPDAFGVNKRGMQAGADLDGTDNDRAREAWLAAMYAAIGQADALAKIGVHKQWANRLIEPFAWHTIIVTATEWENFFNLRISPEAQPEIRRMAVLMKAAMDGSDPDSVPPGTWHLPFVDIPGDVSEENYELEVETQVKLSVARCARVSYLTHDGKRDAAADIALYERLLASGHMSPFEHAARVAEESELGEAFRSSNFRAPWIQHRKELPSEAVFRGSR